MDAAGRGSAPSLEARVAAGVSALVAGLPVGAEFEVEPSASLCSSLEFFLPQLLSRSYPEWRGESLDGVFVARARKTAPFAVQLVGTCILISDQTVTPFMVDLATSLSGEALVSFRVCLGEPGSGPLGISGPACTSSEADKLLFALTNRLDGIAWSYVAVSDEH